MGQHSVVILVYGKHYLNIIMKLIIHNSTWRLVNFIPENTMNPVSRLGRTLALPSPLKFKNSSMMTDCPYWGHILKATYKAPVVYFTGTGVVFLLVTAGNTTKSIYSNCRIAAYRDPLLRKDLTNIGSIILLFVLELYL